MYRIKFFHQKNGATQARELDNLGLETSTFTNKEAYNYGRQVLAKFARHYVNNYDGADDDSRLENAKYYLKELTKNNINNYREDNSTYFFKVFKIK